MTVKYTDHTVTTLLTLSLTQSPCIYLIEIRFLMLLVTNFHYAISSKNFENSPTHPEIRSQPENYVVTLLPKFNGVAYPPKDAICRSNISF